MPQSGLGGLNLPPSTPQIPSSARPPSPKRQKFDDHAAGLIPEPLFLKSHPNPTTVKVEIPRGENKSGWALNGQVITISVNPTDSISTLKERIHEATSIPPNKQKVKHANRP